MKEYKSSEYLVDYLKTKGVKVNNYEMAINNLNNYTYFGTVNAYRDIFIKDGKYIEGVSFEEIMALYFFDRNLKMIFLKYALEIETLMKSYISSIIGERYGIKDYLKKENFDERKSDELYTVFEEGVLKSIEDNYSKNDAIKHYQDNYGFIPPYVLIKVLTMGQTSKLYSLLKQSDRQAISKRFGLSDNDLKQLLLNITLVRNRACHLERLYVFKSNHTINAKVFKNININGKDNLNCLYTIFLGTCIFLTDKQIKEFNQEIKKELNKLSKKLKSVNITKVLDKMGFPMDYLK